MFFTLTLGSGASSTGGAAAEALGAGGASVAAEADAAGAGPTADGIAEGATTGAAVGDCVADTVEAVAVAFVAAAEPSGADAPEQAINPKVIAPIALPRKTISFISRWFIVIPDSFALLSIFSRLHYAVRASH